MDTTKCYFALDSRDVSPILGLALRTLTTALALLAKALLVF